MPHHRKVRTFGIGWRIVRFYHSYALHTINTLDTKVMTFTGVMIAGIIVSNSPN